MLWTVEEKQTTQVSFIRYASIAISERRGVSGYLGRPGEVAVVDGEDGELPAEQVDRHVVATRARLQHGREEAGGEGESAHPEHHRRVRRRRPLLELVDARHQITCPRAERLERRVGLQRAAANTDLCVRQYSQLLILLTCNNVI